MRKRARASTTGDLAVVDIWKREVGELSSTNFARRIGASEDLVLRLEIHKKLKKHRGCVNTVSFNEYGNILISGSDDKRVILWDWECGNVKLSFRSGHTNNIFQAKAMPYSGDQSIVTCAADGQVRHALIHSGGDVGTTFLARHQGRANRLAIEPGNANIFYSCGEDGVVQRIDLRTKGATELFTCQPVGKRSHLSAVHLIAIAMDPRNPNLFSVAGGDEFARLFDIRRYKLNGSTDFGQPVEFFCPSHLVDDDLVGITGLAFSDQSELLVSYNDELIYLFSKNMGLGPDRVRTSPTGSGIASASGMDSEVKSGPQVYTGHVNCVTVKGVNFCGPNSDYVVSGSDCGRIFIWKKKNGDLMRVMEGDKNVVNCIVGHPRANVLASSGIENDIKIWTPTALDNKPTLPTNIEKGRPNRRRWMNGFLLPEELLLQLVSRRRWRSEPESGDDGAESDAGANMLQLLWSFNADGNASSDEN